MHPVFGVEPIFHVIYHVHDIHDLCVIIVHLPFCRVHFKLRPSNYHIAGFKQQKGCRASREDTRSIEVSTEALEDQFVIGRLNYLLIMRFCGRLATSP